MGRPGPYVTARHRLTRQGRAGTDPDSAEATAPGGTNGTAPDPRGRPDRL